MEIIFTIIIGMLIFADIRLYKTFFTPFALLSTVYLVLILLNNHVAVNLGFFKIESISIAYILYFLILIYFISVIFYFLFKKNKLIPEHNAQKYIKNVVFNYKKVILFVFLIGLAAKYLSLFQVISIYGFGNIKGKAFGLFAHIGILGLVLTPYLLIFYLQNKKIKYLVLILMMYINLLLFGGKYEIMIAILHLTILYSMLYNINIKKTIKVGLFTILIGVAIFVTIYAIIPSLNSNTLNYAIFNDRVMFSLRHFLYYLLSPVEATNYYFANTGVGSLDILFTVPINIVKAIFSAGDYVNPINPIFIPIHSYYRTNVGGLFAETVYHSSLLVASVYIVLFFMFVYFIFNMARYRGRLLSLSALLLAIVTMMFFGNFLTVSGVVLQIIFLFIIELIIMKKIVLRKRD